MALQGQDPITDAIKADMAIKDAIFHKTTTPDSSVPSPYVPADVIVTVPVTELPVTVRTFPHHCFLPIPSCTIGLKQVHISCLYCQHALAALFVHHAAITISP